MGSDSGSDKKIWLVWAVGSIFLVIAILGFKVLLDTLKPADKPQTTSAPVTSQNLNEGQGSRPVQTSYKGVPFQDGTFWLPADNAKPGPDGLPVPRLVLSCASGKPEAWLEVAAPAIGYDDDPTFTVPTLLKPGGGGKDRLCQPTREKGGKRLIFASPVFLVALMVKESSVGVDYPQPADKGGVVQLNFKTGTLVYALISSSGACWKGALEEDLASVPGGSEYELHGSSDDSILQPSKAGEIIQPMDKVQPLKLLYKEPVTYLSSLRDNVPYRAR